MAADTTTAAIAPSDDEVPDYKQGTSGSATSDVSAETPVFVRPASFRVDRQFLKSAAVGVGSPGADLWTDTKLSSRGLACSNCHSGGRLFKESFKQSYPHAVGTVAEKFGVEQVDIDEMVNFCISQFAKGDILDWNSDQLLHLSAYAMEQQRQFIDGSSSQYKN